MGTKERRLKEHKKRYKNIVKNAEHILTKKGFKYLTIRNVARNLNLSEGTIYLYFKNKDELISAVMRRCISHLLDELNQIEMDKNDGKTYASKLFKVYLNFVKSDASCFRVIHENREKLLSNSTLEDSEVLKAMMKDNMEILQIFKNAVELGVKDGSFRKDIDPMRSAMVIGILTESFFNHIFHPSFKREIKGEGCFNFNPEDLIKEYYQLIIRSFQPRTV